jgi:hypothetical protein
MRLERLKAVEALSGAGEVLGGRERKLGWRDLLVGHFMSPMKAISFIRWERETA